MQPLNNHRLQDSAQLTRQAYVPRVHNRRASSTFVQAHRGAALESRPRRGLRIGGDPRRSSGDNGDVWSGCMLHLPGLVEIGHGDPCES